MIILAYYIFLRLRNTRWVSNQQLVLFYVGVGIVNSEAQMAKDAVISIGDQKCPFPTLSLKGDYGMDKDDPETAEYIVGIDWEYTTSENKAVKETGFFGNQNTICRPTSPKWEFTVGRLKQLWNID